MFHESRRFAFAAVLERNWQAIRDEYLEVAADARDWPERDLCERGWQVFGLFDFPGGSPMPENIRRCELTGDLVARHLPGHGAAGFSVLQPGTRVRPHRGYQGNFLRCHLGLMVPEGDCAIEVLGQARRWREGEIMVFDDRVEHCAWNLADRPRVVLLIDFPEPAG